MTDTPETAELRAPFHHVAGLNLFREPDGTHEITVASADATVLTETEAGLKPIDHIENLILAAAERMKARKVADGTYRIVSRKDSHYDR